MGESKELNNVLTPEAIRDLTAERDRLRTEVSELRRALDEARREVGDRAAIAAERYLYLRELEEFWAEKIADMDKNGIALGEVVAEVERDLRARGMLDAK